MALLALGAWGRNHMEAVVSREAEVMPGQAVREIDVT
jgi:hypothetical protein